VDDPYPLVVKGNQDRRGDKGKKIKEAAAAGDQDMAEVLNAVYQII